MTKRNFCNFWTKQKFSIPFFGFYFREVPTVTDFRALEKVFLTYEILSVHTDSAQLPEVSINTSLPGSGQTDLSPVAELLVILVNFDRTVGRGLVDSDPEDEKRMNEKLCVGKEGVKTGGWGGWRDWSRKTKLTLVSETERLLVVIGLLCWTFSLFLHQ